MDALEQAVLSGKLTGSGGSENVPVDDPTRAEPRRADSDEGERETPKSIREDAPRHGTGHATGPKGVLNDYIQQQREQKEHPTTDSTSTTDIDDLIDDPDLIKLQLHQQKQLQQNSAEREKASRRFGYLREIGAHQFEHAVLGEHAAVTVVVHIYEPHIDACRLLDARLANIARDFPDTKFLRARASDIDFAVNTADVVLPTIVAYRAGELVARLVALNRKWPRQNQVSTKFISEILSRCVHVIIFFCLL